MKGLFLYTYRKFTLEWLSLLSPDVVGKRNSSEGISCSWQPLQYLTIFLQLLTTIFHTITITNFRRYSIYGRIIILPIFKFFKHETCQLQDRQSCELKIFNSPSFFKFVVRKFLKNSFCSQTLWFSLKKVQIFFLCSDVCSLNCKLQNIPEFAGCLLTISEVLDALYLPIYKKNWSYWF